MAVTKNDGIQKAPREDAADKSRDYVRRHWKYTEPISPSSGSCCESASACRPDPFYSLLNQIQTHSLCISGMAFQDVWNIDLDRLQRCCVHVATANNKLIPFCVYYLTNSNGLRLINRDASYLLK